MLIGSDCDPRKHDGGFRLSVEMKGGKKKRVEFQLFMMREYTGDLLNDSVITSKGPSRSSNQTA